MLLLKLKIFARVVGSVLPTFFFERRLGATQHLCASISINIEQATIFESLANDSFFFRLYSNLDNFIRDLEQACRSQPNACDYPCYMPLSLTSCAFGFSRLEKLRPTSHREQVGPILQRAQMGGGPLKKICRGRSFKSKARDRESPSYISWRARTVHNRKSRCRKFSIQANFPS